MAYWSTAAICLFAIGLLWGWWQIGTFLALTAVVGLHHGRHVMHPWTWFPPFFAAYSAMYPLSLLVVGTGYDQWTQTALFYHAVALVAFTAGAGIFGPVKKPPPARFLEPFRITERQRLLFRALLLLLFAITAVHLAVVATGGYTSKQQIADAKSGNPLLLLEVFYPLIPMTVMLLIIRSYRLQGKLSPVLWVALGWLSLGYLVIGERDILFRMVLVLFLFWFDQLRPFRVSYLYALLLIAIVVMPVTQALKGALIGGSSGALAFGAVEIFHGEFMAAGRNLHTLLTTGAGPGDGPPMWAMLLRVLPATGDVAMSLTQWFDEVYRPSIGRGSPIGWGFTMVGAGWLTAGIPGIVILFALIGGASMWFYRRRMRSSYWYTAYLLYVPNVIYVMRADPTNYINLTLKTVVLPLAIVYAACWFAGHLVRKGQRRSLPQPLIDRAQRLSSV